MSQDVVRLIRGRVAFDCPGCGSFHAVPVVGHSTETPLWGWNGNTERPSLVPSLLVTWDVGEQRRRHVCHSFVTDGRIQFLGDCTHAKAGQTIDLPALPADWWANG